MSCPSFVKAVENGVNPLFSVQLQDLRAKELDAALLVCTHYPILKSLIQKELGMSVALIDPSKEVCLEIQEYLKLADLLNTGISPLHQFYVTGRAENFMKIASQFLKRDVFPVQLD